MSLGASETPTIGLGKHLSNSSMLVPSHQRDYKWRKEYIDQFIDDIIEAKEKIEPRYFCGLMVFVKTGEDEYSILDGQQRLATTVIFYSAVRNWLYKTSEFEGFGRQIERDFLGDARLGDTEPTPKLRLNSANDDIFKSYVINRHPVSEIRKASRGIGSSDRNKPLLGAIVHLNQRIEDIASNFVSSIEAKDYLIELCKYLENAVRVVVLSVQSEESAYTLFETLNDRGMELAPLDLVKNHLFGQASRSEKGDLRGMESRWAEMMAVLDESKPDSFLRAFWASRHGVPGTSRLFKPFKEAYNDADKAFRVSVDLRRVSEDYVSLSDPHDSTWNRYTEKCRKHIEALKVFGSTQFYPIILSALNKPEIFDPSKMERLLRLIEVLAVRHSLIGKGRPGRIESLGARVAQKIHNGSLSAVPEIRRQLGELYRDDESFRQSFSTFGEGPSKQVRMILELLDQQAKLSKNDPHFAEQRADEVTLEHILPKNPNDEWRATLAEDGLGDDDEREKYTYRLGNVCLLSRVNQQIGNIGFSRKKEALSGSSFVLTRTVAEKDRWGKDEIIERQNKLASLALHRWRFDELEER